MKKGIILLSCATVLFVSGLSFAAGTAGTAEDGLGITLDTTWVSKYIWRGFDLLDDKAAFQPSVDFDLYGSGFNFKVWSSFAGASKNGGSVSTVNAEEWDYIIGYSNSINEGQQCQTDYSVNYVYYNYPDMASWNADMQEINLTLSMPNICPFGSVPHYTIIKMWPSRGGHAARAKGGFIHVFGLGYDVSTTDISPDLPAMPLHLSWDITYNDGTYGKTVAHDWSHMVWGAATSMELGQGTLRPGLFYQVSMEDTVNKQDEFWTGISYSLKF